MISARNSRYLEVRPVRGKETVMALLHRALLTVFVFTLFAHPLFAGQFKIEKVSDNVYAAIAQPSTRMVSNAFIVITGTEVIVAGSHFTKDGFKELLTSITSITHLPVTTTILTHHHKGLNYYDYDLPEDIEIIITSNIWQVFKSELRELKSPTLVFDNAITLNRGKSSLVIMNTGAGHSQGDLIVFLPNEGVLFASDLLFNRYFGYMGEASIIEWGETIEMLEQLMPVKVVPGMGEVGGNELISSFMNFYREFMTEVIRNVDKGNTLAQTKKEFSLKKYRDLPGYGDYLDVNLERAYKQYKSRK